MNTDDPKLTAFALDELDESERSMIARAVADSVEAQRVVDETKNLAQALRNEFAAELQKKSARPANLIDIREESWFWARARPLALAAMVAIFAILGAIVFGNFKSRRDSNTVSSDRITEIEAEEPARNEVLSARSHPNEVPNPLRRDLVQRIERVVIGELGVDSQLQSGEIRVIETIKDAYRIHWLKERLATPVLLRKSHPGIAGRRYELIFLDRDGHVVASAAFYRVGSSEFVLQPSKYGSESGGHYFPERGDTVLPGDWKSEIDYLAYAIPFPDWSECIGYSPGV